MALNSTNQTYDLFDVKKNKLLWQGDLSQLKTFVANEVNQRDAENAIWRSPSGGTWCFKGEGDDLLVTWHSKSKTISFDGKAADEIKERIHEAISNKYTDLTNVEVANVEATNVEAAKVEATNVEATNVEATNDEAADIEARDNTNAIELVNISDSTLLPNDLCGKWSDLADKVELLEDRMNNNFMDIAKSINSLKAKEGLNTELSREYVDSIVRENVKLRQDNENLRERSENLSYIISDLNTKAKRFENEKESLITALGMLQSDLNEKYKGADWQTVKGSVIKNGSCKQMSASSIDADTNPNVEISNRFESLIYEGDEESDDQEIPNTTKTKEKLSLQQKGFGKNQMSESDDKAAQSKANKQRSQQINQEQKHKKNKNKKQKVKNNEQKVKENEQTREAHKASEEITAERQRTKETVVIAGDSIIKYVKGWEVSNTDRNVIVKSFSGATVNDMSDFLKPTARKQPDKLIIHAGTNDIRYSSPKEIAKKIIELAENFKKDCNDTEVIISSLVTRCDREELTTKVNETNNILKSSCLKKKLAFLDNSNISRSHLNSRGLHLNREGSSLLQANFSYFLSSHN